MADLIDREAARKAICERCENYSTVLKECNLSGGWCKVFSLYDVPAVDNWIPCSERLPENGARVLVCFRSGTVHIAVWCGDYDEKGAWRVTSQYTPKLYRTDIIPKWMPMPDAYEPSKE